jgi:hypothetical protein
MILRLSCMVLPTGVQLSRLREVIQGIYLDYGLKSDTHTAHRGLNKPSIAILQAGKTI